MNVGSLFSGIGGLDHGLARAGHEHVFFCESDEWRRDVLAARWPGVPIYDDVRDVEREDRADGIERKGDQARGDRHPGSDQRIRDHLGLLCGGFPCQDLSVAGRRAGLAGDRSGLFFEFARIIDAFRPGWVLVENVPGLLSSNGGRDFGVVLGTLADLGYGVAWRILDSRFFGVPQRRRRVFIVGAVAVGDPRAAAERAGQVLAVGSRCERHPPQGGEAGEDVAAASTVSTLASSGRSGGWRIGADEAAGGQLVAGTLREHPRPGSNSDGAVTAFASKGGGGGAFHEDGVSPTLSAHGSEEGGQPPAIAFALRKDPGGVGQGHNTNYVAGPLGGGNDGIGRRSEDDPNTVVQAGVRRLTPRECERLQGLPDDWTLLDAKTTDSRRYSALGDAVTANVAEWIGRRLG